MIGRDKANLKVLELALAKEGAETIDTIEGVLLDDVFLVIDGVYMIFEVVPLNTWQSEYNWYTSIDETEMYSLWSKIKEGRNAQ